MIELMDAAARLNMLPCGIDWQPCRGLGANSTFNSNHNNNTHELL